MSRTPRDPMKTAAQLVLAWGLAFQWPGPQLVALLGERGAAEPASPPARIDPAPPPARPVQPATPGTARGWFDSVRGSCNALEAGQRLRATPPPTGTDGAGYAATCLALAGRIDDARERIDALEPGERWKAARIVFGTGHPVADAGDDIAAGPLMELVVEYWPNNYMALYHAGAAAWERGEREAARPYLESFLEEYSLEDGWRRNAERMLAETGPR